MNTLRYFPQVYSIIFPIFPIKFKSDVPGPGAYGRLNTFEGRSTSFSKKGTGAFPSKVCIKRILYLYDTRTRSINRLSEGIESEPRER